MDDDHRPSDRDEQGRWILASEATVATALRSDDLVVVAPALPPGRLADLVGRMARFRDGSDHEGARRIAVDALAAVDVDAVRRASFDTMRGALSHALDRAGRADLTELARRTTTAVLGRALGFTRATAIDGRTIDALLVLASAIAPRVDEAGRSASEVERAIDHLEAASPSRDPLVTANLIGLLFQAIDATTGLVTGALDPVPGPDAIAAGCGRERVLAAVALAPPVVSTRRVATRTAPVGGRVVAAGEELVLVLAADATRGDRVGVRPDPSTDRPLAFGSGRHACPGLQHAIAIATGVVDAAAAVIDEGARLAPRGLDERRSNLRIAEALELLAATRPVPADQSSVSGNTGSRLSK